jgi:signal peptide peptidase SppA
MLLAIMDEAFNEWRGQVDALFRSGAIGATLLAMRSPEAATSILPGRKSVGSVAVISLSGMMSQKPSLWSVIFGGTSTEAFAREVVGALNDSSIGSVIMNIDSPGGSVHGLPEAAAAIRGARGGKPLLAVANPMAGSAAYYMASQADPGSVYATPSGLVGSIGTIVEHFDFSGRMEKEGIKLTVLRYGKNKGGGHPGMPLSEDATAQTQAVVDSFGRAFEADVAAGRGISVDKVRSSYGQGQVFHAESGMAAGLVDGIATLDQLVGKMANRLGPRQAGARAEADALDFGV